MVEREVNYEEVVVTEITPEGTFYVQKISDGPKAEALLSQLRQEFQANPPLPGAYTPRRGDICAAKFTLDDEWYRVKVEKIQGGNIFVHYIDYGNKENLPCTRLANLPATYANEKPFATEYVMPFVILPKDEEFTGLFLKCFREDSADSKLLLNVEYKNAGSPPAASLHTDRTSDSDIIKNLIREGLLVVDSKSRRTSKLVSRNIKDLNIVRILMKFYSRLYKIYCMLKILLKAGCLKPSSISKRIWSSDEVIFYIVDYI